MFCQHNTVSYCSHSGSDSFEYQQKLVSAGACEAVTKALLKYSEYETIAHACFRSLVVLLINNVTYKSKLGALGVCSCVVEAMHMFPYSAQVAKWGCRAVAVLAESHEANIARLGQLNFFFLPYLPFIFICSYMRGDTFLSFM